MDAIAVVESGRPDRDTGVKAPWPWTINADGQGRFFETKAEAIAAVRALQAQGVRSIDVGCMQVNLLYHPTAFLDLDDAFDPVANADYAARFLLSLHWRTGGWLPATMAYHSSSPELGRPYLARVMAEWGDVGSDDASLYLEAAVPFGLGYAVGREAEVVFEPGTAFPVALPAALRASFPPARSRARRAVGRVLP